MNVVIITGASSGMGREFALQLDQGLHTIDEFWLIARRGKRLEDLAGKLKHKTRSFAIDLTDPVEMNAFARVLETKRPAVRMLINSAGYGVMGNVADLEVEEQTGMIDLNCMALTRLTRLCLPFMKEKSRIIQLASSAAFLPQPGFAVYAAGKAYVLSFSRALGEELKDRGILVTAVCPGPVRTEFFERAEQKASTLAIKKYVMADAEDVVRDALSASAKGRSMAVYSLPIKAFGVLTKLCPHSLILMVMSFLKRR
ncbi:MAG TPA: SDR family NAD(P)-dependent oxidoreductase [Candidatus Eisenbergiella merdipullorum]|uniref:SDR family NAD(P)-dependent oxidoreductase n=1 Tax=Candidatus Eisenbergiella merdipullorum TaxID=2838553 RepID=A0A9D2I9E4_9FIRM|nr:SDR family NAD(P)-dependent oxidoreductase [Candidatus Eisenbergiella merdipullorum]